MTMIYTCLLCSSQEWPVYDQALCQAAEAANTSSLILSICLLRVAWLPALLVTFRCVVEVPRPSCRVARGDVRPWFPRCREFIIEGSRCQVGAR